MSRERTPARSAPLESVELEESEVIRGRGRHSTHYLVRVEDAWVPASKFPGASVRPLDAGPGTVWERRVELMLPRGTRLVRVVSQPRPEPPRDPLDYLTGSARGTKRQTLKTELVVSAGGRLRSVEPKAGPRGTPGRSG